MIVGTAPEADYFVVLERDTARDLNVPRRRDDSIPIAKVRTRYIGVECAAAVPPDNRNVPTLLKWCCIENVKCVSAQLEGETLGDVNRFLQSDVEVAITGLPEVLNAWSLARVES